MRAYGLDYLDYYVYNLNYVFLSGKFKGRKFKNVVKSIKSEREINAIIDKSLKNPFKHEVEDLFQLMVMKYDFKDLKVIFPNKKGRSA